MITTNFKKMINNGIKRSSNNTSAFYVKDYLGNSVYAGGMGSASSTQNNLYLNYSYNKPFGSGSSNIGTSSCVYVGTGDTTPEDESNYNLDAICSDVSAISGSLAYDDNIGKVVITQTFSYTGAEDTQIKEIGLFKGFFTDVGVMYFCTLLAREILESPISVSQNDTFTVTMMIG